MLNRYLLQNGLISNETELIMLDNNTLQLKPELFYKDAIVLKHINSKEITLRTNKDSHGLKFKFDGFPYFGIWAAKNAPFAVAVRSLERSRLRAVRGSEKGSYTPMRQ